MKLDALFDNGRFTTLDGHRPVASSMGVIDGIVVGFDEELSGCTAEVRHDLGGAPVLPGFHDAHHHLSQRGKELQTCDVSPSAVSTMEELYAAIARHAAGLDADAWVLGAGYDQLKLGGVPRREALDAAAGGRPLWLVQASRHGGVANTEAFRRMGYQDLRDVPDIDGGEVERDDRGRATGVLAERATRLVTDLTRPGPLEKFLAGLELAGRAALSEGLTSITEPGIAGGLAGDGPTDLASYQAARERGLLGPRMTLMPEVSALHDIPGDAPGGAGFGLDLGLRTGLGDDRLRIGGVKVFSDGALSVRTAALCCDYADRAGSRGLLHEQPEILHRRILSAAAAGWQVATHAIGDAAVETVLDAYEQARLRYPENTARHRIEHCGITSDRQIGRIKQLGVIPVPQGRFLSELGDSYLAAIGPERGELLYRQRSFLEAGIEVPGSSDCPVVNGEPLLGIQALVGRELPDGSVLNPGERLTPLQAVRAFTYGSAYADHQEHRKGTLSRGKLADFVVLSDDLFAVPPDAIAGLRVAATIVGGEVRHGTDWLTPR